MNRFLLTFCILLGGGIGIDSSLAKPAADVVPEQGPSSGGNTILITNGYFTTILEVQVGGTVAAIQGAGETWVAITAPAAAAAGFTEIRIQDAEAGDLVLANGYYYNPPG